MRRKIKLGVAGASAATLVAMAGTLIAKMTGNANFPTPTPPLADIQAATDALATAAVAASGGDREAILVRKARERELANMIRTLAAYVSMTAEGDGAIIASAGFELQRLGEPQPMITRPVDFIAARGEHTGEVELSWRRVRNAMSYVIEMTTGDPALPETAWTTVAITTKVKAKFDGLQIGIFYYYRVKAIGRNNESPFSDVSLVMTAAA